jgi:signal transduction histidine kinase
VLVDLATPIEVEGARDLLRRGLARVLGAAVAGTPPGGGVTARAQILVGGRARIDIQDQCGGAHAARPRLALVGVVVGDDWSIVRGTVAANGGTVHRRRLPGVGCVVTIDLPGHGDDEPCCDGESATTGK